MKLMTRLMGAAAIAVSAMTATPIWADGSLVILSTQTPRHLNGAVQSGIATAVPSTQLFASLVRYDSGWEPQPYLAKSWETSEDGRTITFRMVDNATFHDGTPVTSEDVAFSIMTIKANHPFQTMFAPVEAVETPDPHTAVFKLSQPHPALMLALSPALAPILPKHVYGDGQDVKSHPANSAVIGSGPFKLKEFTPGEAIILEKNPNFFMEGRPVLDEILIKLVKDPSALLISMENGEGDMYPYMAGSQEIKRLQEVEALEVTDQGYAAIGPINWLAFNTASPKLSDKRVRQAIAYAVDREFIVKALHRGVSTAQRGPIIESSPFFDAGIEPFAVDLEKSKALLAEAGVALPLALTIDYIPGPKEQQQSVAEYLKSQLKKIGIELEVRAAPDFPTWAGRVGGHDFELSMDVVFNWGDPVIGVHRTYLTSNIRKGVIWSNTQSYSNPKVDEILAAAAVEPDMAKRTALYSEFQKIVVEDVPITFINASPYHTACKDGLEGAPMGIWGPMHPMDTMSWKK